MASSRRHKPAKTAARIKDAEKPTGITAFNPIKDCPTASSENFLLPLDTYLP
jgi:hypothetical protein